MAGRYTDLDVYGLVAGFRDQYEQAVGGAWGTSLMLKVPSKTATETMTWLGRSPALREWVGGRQMKALNKYTQQLTNVKYEASLPILVDDLDDDKTGQLAASVGEMAQIAADHPTSLLATLVDGNTYPAKDGSYYDSQNFFATAHAESGSSQVNECTATQVPSADVTTAASPTADEMAAILVEAIGHYYTLTDDQGNPRNGADKQFRIVTTTAAQYAAALKAVSLNNLASGATNPVMGLNSIGVNFDVVLEPRCTTMAAATQFCIINTDSAVRPFIWQVRQDLTEQIIGPGSEHEFINDEYVYGIKARYAVGFGFWQKALRITLS